ncbi:MAG: carboxymuconolactone decarboxylase, partial [Gammaproteobacteria bacterium]
MAEQRISFIDPDSITDEAMIAEFERCAKFGTPRPESQAIRAHRPPIMMAFATAWKDSFHEGVCDHNIKELCRVYVSRSVKCEYCGNQRSEKSRNAGVVEADYMDLLNFEKSDQYDERQKAALAYTEAITWDVETDDALWKRLHTHFTEPEIVEL